MKITIEWGARSRALRARLKQSARSPSTSFWLMPTASPVSLGSLAEQAIASWDTAPTTSIPVTMDAANQSVSAHVPQGVTHLRLDFDLKATVGSATGSVLSFRQLFLVHAQANSDHGTLTGQQYWFPARIIEPSATKPTFKPLGWPGSPRRLGLHPLLSATTNRIAVNAEFVDVTELWWQVRADRWGWYLNKDLGGRQEYLRVLAWTGGGDPMIWFAVISDAAAGSDLKAQAAPVAGQTAPSPPADIVFYRPPPGVNSFPYAATAKGFLDTRHDDTTMYILARYLLSPIPAHRFIEIQKGGRVTLPELLADQIQPVTITPKIEPPDPMKIDEASGHGFRAKFRPVGLEAAVNRSRGAGVLFLPLAAGDHDHPYDGAQVNDLKATVRSALTVLWNGFAFGILAGSSPSFTGRDLWLAGHSAGNLSMWVGLNNNKTDVVRVISSDATPKSTNLAAGLPIVRAAAAARKNAGRKLDVFAITTPNMTGQAASGLTDSIDRDLRKTLADITVLPPFDRRSTYWNLPPTTGTNAYLRYLLTNWTDDLLTASAKNPGNWFFLFFHELAMFGGDLIPAASPPPNVQALPPLPVLPQGMQQPQYPKEQQPSGQKPAQAPAGRQPAAGTGVVVRTFFEMALGAPNPRPAASAT